ncbi:MAG: peptidylprolyl isomerase [Alphaproteobacteria bacterium]|jgi:peptidyl-prolyl cis-trans isomerase SurA|nr:MAG: peptidylprolyl isomerase [Alphaproteobacteria bacterium]
MMKLGWFPRAAIVLIAPLLSIVAAAQSGAPQGQLDIPGNIQFVGKQEPGVRKATAVVNGEVITGSDIDHRLALVVASSQARIPPEELERVRAQILRNLIDETLQIQAATQQEITIAQHDIDEYYARFAQSFRRTPEQFSAYLRSIGSSESSLKRQIHGELAWQRLQRRQIEPFVTVGEDEVRAVIERLNAERGTAEYRVAEIFMSSTPETAAQVQQNAARILQQLRGGASFAAYARQYSEASTAAVGGDLGWVRAGQLPDELAAVVRQMPVGAFSDPIPVPGGISIVALVDTRQILVADPRDAVLSLTQISLDLPAGATDAQIQAKVQQLGAAVQAMHGCGGAAATARTLGGEVLVNDSVRVRELPAALQPMLLGLSVGQATTVFGSRERISSLVLCGRDDPAPVAGPNAADIQRQIEEERVNRRAQRYLRDLRRDAVIDYR